MALKEYIERDLVMGRELNLYMGKGLGMGWWLDITSVSFATAIDEFGQRKIIIPSQKVKNKRFYFDIEQDVENAFNRIKTNGLSIISNE